MAKGIFLLPYFGPLPRWVELFLFTCARNPDYDFVIYSDQPEPARPIAANVKWRALTLQGLVLRVEDAIGIPLPGPFSPIKACDFRPAFGEVFADDIGDIPFWGHADIDIFWGRIGVALTPAILTHDVISAHRSRLCGPFTLYRNTAGINSLYRLAPQTTAAFADPAHLAYDEIGFSRHVLAQADAGAIRFAGGVGNQSHSESKGEYIYLDSRISRRSPFLEAVQPLLPGAVSRALSARAESMFFHFRTWKNTISYDFDPSQVRGWRLSATRLDPIM